MTWLLWREYRLNRLILMTGLILLLLPYLVALVVWIRVDRPLADGVPNAVVAAAAAAFYSILLAHVTLAFLGGNAVSGERADRSAEFMAYLPVSRGRRLCCKLLLALCAAAVTWGINLLVLLALVRPARLAQVEFPPDVALLVIWAITGLVFYGVSWLVSALQSSSTFAICSGLITPMLIVMGLQAAAWIRSVPADGRYIAYHYAICAIILGLACFVAGATYYLRRVEP